MPLPLTPLTATVQLPSEYRVNVTDPVGATAPARVTVSITVTCVPAVATSGLASVLIVGEALTTVKGSQLLVGVP